MATVPWECLEIAKKRFGTRFSVKRRLESLGARASSAGDTRPPVYVLAHAFKHPLPQRATETAAYGAAVHAGGHPRAVEWRRGGGAAPILVSAHLAAGSHVGLRSGPAHAAGAPNTAGTKSACRGQGPVRAASGRSSWEPAVCTCSGSPSVRTATPECSPPPPPPRRQPPLPACRQRRLTFAVPLPSPACTPASACRRATSSGIPRATAMSSSCSSATTRPACSSSCCAPRRRAASLATWWASLPRSAAATPTSPRGLRQR